MKTYGIILASGTGSRYHSILPKQFIKLAGKTILEHTIEIFEKENCIDEIILVITPEYRTLAENILLKNHFKKITKLLNGGKTRKESSSIGIYSIDDEEANVVIHDCARPFLSPRIIHDCIEALKTHNAIDVAIPSADTIIQVKDHYIASIPNRNELMRGQTPQCFKLSLIKHAHELAKNDDNFTDDCGLILKYKLSDVYVVDGDGENIKITYPEDIFLADKLFQMRSILYSNDIDLTALKDKVIVIFGGTSGIGQCIANLCKQYNAHPYIASTRTGCDITSYENVTNYLAKVYETTQRIDSVINTAGILRMGKLLDRNIGDIQQDIAINYIGAINVAKASIPYLKKTEGSLLFFASSSYTRGRSLYSTYSSTKAAIVNLAQALSEELIQDNIHINVINPERTATPMRFKAFGKEPDGSLLSPKLVAEASLKTILTNLTGQVIDVRRKE